MPLFRRATTRESFERYCTGLLTDLPHKTCDGIAAAVAGTTTERLQHLLTDADWDPLALDRERVHQMIEVSLPGGVLALDDTTFPKQGKHSVGVAHQYCGELGKRANCQAVVTAEYIVDDPCFGTVMHWPVSARLFLPESWAADAERRRRAHVPPEIRKQSKPEIALELIDRAITWGIPFRLVTADAAYGHFRDFFEGLEARRLVYACAVKNSFGVRRPEEVREAQEAPPAPRKGTHGRRAKRHPAPLYRVDEVISGLPPEAWTPITWREGSKGPMQKQFAALRMHWGKGCQARSLDDPRTTTSAEGWLIAERPLISTASSEEETKYYFSNLPVETSLEELARAVRGRWPTRAVLRRRQTALRAGRLPGTPLGWSAPPHRAGDALLQLPRRHALAGYRRSAHTAGSASPGATGAPDQPRRALGARQAVLCARAVHVSA